jgi:nitrogen regulatory protein PII
MYFLAVFVLNDPDRCHDILDAWEGAGVRGITILQSSGLGRVRKAGMLDDLPLIPSLDDLFKHTETHHRTLLTVVKDQNQIDAIVNATQEVIGDLEQKDTGILFVVPVSQVYGKSKLG